MSFTYNPRSDAEIYEIRNRKLLTDGVYPFIVKEIIENISSKGNPMLEVILGILEKDGSERNIKDYLVATDEMIYKLKHFCESIGMEEEYKKGNLPPTMLQKFINRSGKAVVGMQKGSAKPDGTGYYPDKNNVKDYIKTDSVQNSNDPEVSDSIPF